MRPRDNFLEDEDSPFVPAECLQGEGEKGVWSALREWVLGWWK